MKQLIKITSVPMQTVRYTQNTRLVSSDSVALERRKAIARQMSFRRSAGRNSVPVEDLTKINRTFSKRTPPAPQAQNVSRRQAAFQQAQAQASVPTPSSASAPAPSAAYGTADTAYAADIAAAVPVQTASSHIDVSAEASSSYTAERGVLEMRVAKGELTFLPPMVMTIVTQYPELHFEYLGDFNYVPPRPSASGGNINLFT